MALKAGTRPGSYEVIAQLGVGGMVTGDDAPVAPPMLVIEPNFSRRLEQLLRTR